MIRHITSVIIGMVILCILPFSYSSDLGQIAAARPESSSLSISPALPPQNRIFLPAILYGRASTTILLPHGFDVEGHRGARGLRPENTLPSFESALDLGVTTLEMDLHFTRDSVLVVWHDHAISADKCFLNSSDHEIDAPDPDNPDTQEDDLMISHLSLQQIKRYRCDRNPDPERFPLQANGETMLAEDNYSIPTLAEVFDFVEDYSKSELKSDFQRTQALKVQFNIETKRDVDNPDVIGDGFDGVNPGAFEQAIIALVTERKLQDRVIVQSFDHRSLWATLQLSQDVRIAALTYQDIALETYAENGAHIWSPFYQDVTAENITQAHSLSMQVIPWTVNDLAEIQILIELGVDGIITDRPDLLLQPE